MAAVDESADIAVTAPATAAEAESSRSSRPDAGEERSEWMAGLTMSVARWAVRLSALLAGLACWHYASSTGLTLYVRFEQIPGPLKVGEALINQLQHVAFYVHIGASLQRISISYSLAAGIGITLGPLMISPASNENQDTPMPIARPAQMLGSAPGRTTWRKMHMREAPSDCAARTSTSGVCSTP